LFINPFNWYNDNNIKLTLGAEVKEIVENSKTLKLSDGTERAYDKLIIATGAESFVPPIKGADKEGVFAIRTLDTINKIRDYLKNGVNTAAVIGGGVLGLEAAWELSKAGLSVTVVEAGPVIMGRQRDEKAGKFLLAAFDKAGVKHAVGTGIEEISGEAKATGVKLADGSIVEADIVIISTGVKQNISLAQGIGIETTRSIVVNDRMETGKEDIYACGDCAEFEGVNYAIWPQAVDMGKIAGANAAGDTAVYKKTTPAVTYNGMNTSIFSIGDVGKTDGKKYKTKEYCDEENLIYEKFYFLNGRFCGGILIGDIKKSGELLKAMEEKTNISEM
jgi:NAD(P)H-nitrite reductase large subunit